MSLRLFAPRLAASLVAASLVAASLAAPSLAFAETAAEAATRWGLLGTWKVDCGAPTSHSNWAVTFRVKDGELIRENDVGDIIQSSPVNSAAIMADGSMEAVLNGADVLRIRWIKDGNRLRAMISQVVGDGTYVIRDGKFTETGRESQWQTHCSK